MAVRTGAGGGGDAEVGDRGRRPGPGVRPILSGLILGVVVVAIALTGCGESEAGSGLSKGEKYDIAQEVIENQGFSSGAAEEARKLAEREGISPRETAELGGIAKGMK